MSDRPVGGEKRKRGEGGPWAKLGVGRGQRAEKTVPRDRTVISSLLDPV